MCNASETVITQYPSPAEARSPTLQIHVHIISRKNQRPKLLLKYQIWPWNLLFGVNTVFQSQGPDQIYNICYKLTQSCLIAVGGYSVFRPGLKYLMAI